MSVGQFAGSFANAYFQARAQRAEQKRQDEIARLQGKLYELKIKSGENQLQAMEGLNDIATGFGPGTGEMFELQQMPSQQTPGGRELTQIGAPAPAKGILEMLVEGDPQVQNLAVQAGIADIGDLLDFKQTNAMLESQNQMMAGMGGGVQGGGVQGLGPVDSAGNPMLIVMPSFSGGRPGFTTALHPNYTPPKTEQQTGNEIQSDFMRIQSAIHRNMMLAEASPGQATGSPFRGGLGLLGRAAEAGFGMAGVDNPFADQSKAAAAQQKLGKDFAVSLFTNEELKTLKDSGRLTNLQMNALQTANPGLENDWAVNASIMLDQMEIKLNNADILGLEVTNEQEIRDYIDDMRMVVEQELQLNEPGPDLATTVGGFADQARAAGSNFMQDVQPEIDAILEELEALKVEGISTLQDFGSATYEQIQQIDLRAISDSIKAPALERWEQLIAEMDEEDLAQLQKDIWGAKGKVGLRIQEIKAAAERRWNELNAEK